MRFSVALPQANYVASPAAIQRTAEVAEDLGFDAVGVQDHIVFGGETMSSGTHDPVPGGDLRTLFEAVTTLAFVAGRTRRVRLLTSILLLPVREPIVLAKQVATIDALSGGRFVCGVAAGPPLVERTGETTRLTTYRANAVKEYAAFRLKGHRGRRVDEYLQAMIAIWTQDRATFEGRYVAFKDVTIFPKPVQKPHPPVWIGGRSEHALERTAAMGDAWHPSQINPEQFGASLPLLRAKCAERGRPAPTEYPINIFVSIAHTDAAADELARPVVQAKFYTEHDYRTRTIIGSPATWIRMLNEWEAVGLTYAHLKFVYRDTDDLVARLRLFAREVMPAFAQRAGDRRQSATA